MRLFAGSDIKELMKKRWKGCEGWWKMIAIYAIYTGISPYI
jgi:hypothetical protein